MHHFFLSPAAIKGDQIIFPAEVGHQIRRVLRLQENDLVMVLDNTGMQYTVQLNQGDVVTGSIVSKQSSITEPSTRVWLYLSLSQREKFEWVLQKGTELGAAGFIPVISSRSLMQDVSAVEKKRERWESILKEAAEQSGRGKIPVLAAVMRYPQAMKHCLNQCDLRLIPAVTEGEQNLKASIENLQAASIGVFIGPEGGFSPQEVQTACEIGFVPVTLGRRVLRMETAALAALTMILYSRGDLD